MLIAASAAAAPGPAPAAAAERVDVCIVGAGPAGVAAAVTLARRNKTIAVLERRDGVGGQAWANWTDPATGVRLLLGAVIIASQEDTTVLGFAKELGIGTQVRSRNAPHLFRTDDAMLTHSVALVISGSTFL